MFLKIRSEYQNIKDELYLGKKISMLMIGKERKVFGILSLKRHLSAESPEMKER